MQFLWVLFQADMVPLSRTVSVISKLVKPTAQTSAIQICVFISVTPPKHFSIKVTVTLDVLKPTKYKVLTSVCHTLLPPPYILEGSPLV